MDRETKFRGGVIGEKMERTFFLINFKEAKINLSPRQLVDVISSSIHYDLTRVNIKLNVPESIYHEIQTQVNISPKNSHTRSLILIISNELEIDKDYLKKDFLGRHNK